MIIRTLLRTILRSGLTTTTIAFALLVIGLTLPQAELQWMGVSFLISQFYTLTLLCNVNVRDSFGRIGSTTSVNYTSARTPSCELPMGGISVNSAYSFRESVILLVPFLQTTLAPSGSRSYLKNMRFELLSNGLCLLIALTDAAEEYE